MHATGKWLGVGGMVLGVLGSVALAEAAKGKNMTDAMREAGFACKTAQWSSTNIQTREGSPAQKTESQFWISGSKFRMEAKDSQKNETMVMIDDGEEQYMIDPKKKTAMKMNEMMRKMYAGFFDSEAFKKAAEQRKAATKVGSEKVSGKPCTIYTYQVTYAEMTSDVKEWIWTAKNFPMRSIVKTPKQTMTMMGQKMVVPASTTENLVTAIAVDKPIPASMFTVPAGYKVESMEQGGGRRGEAMDAGEDEESDANEDEESGGGKKSKEVPAEVKDLMKGLF